MLDDADLIGPQIVDDLTDHGGLAGRGPAGDAEADRAEPQWTVYTIGHSTRSAGELIALLRQHGVTLVVDVRRFPTSRLHPQFVKEALAETLGAAGIDYVHEPDLGGRRAPRPDSPNTAWRTGGFRGYADHMATEPFRQAFERLVRAARERPTAVMCAEAVPWRCHRQLVADQLVLRGCRVVHVVGPDRVELHRLHPAARVTADGAVVYGEEVHGG